MNSLLQGKQQAVAGSLNSVCRYLDTKNDSVELSEVAKVRWLLFDLRVRSIMSTAAERFLKKAFADDIFKSRTSYYTYCNHSNELDTLVNQDDHAAPIRSPVRGRTAFSKSRGLRASVPFFPSPTPFLPSLCSCPIFRSSRMQKTNTRGQNFVRFVRERLLSRLLIIMSSA